MAVTTSEPTAKSVLERIAADRPKFHLADHDSSSSRTGDEVVLHALPQTLEFIAANTSADSSTLETGSGATTVVFAAAGATHTAVSPVPHEHDRIGEYCASIGVRTDRLSFIAASSDEIVPTLSEPLDLVFLDGNHAFPYAVIEWHYLGRLLRPGGIMVVDDLPIPAIAILGDFMQSDDDWEIVEHLDRRAVAYRKLRHSPEQRWPDQPFNDSYPDYSHLPARDRISAELDHGARTFRSAVGAKLPALRKLRRKS